MSTTAEKNSKQRAFPSFSSITVRLGRMLSQIENVCSNDRGMCESAAMVYIGDVYSLRDDLQVPDKPRRPRHFED